MPATTDDPAWEHRFEFIPLKDWAIRATARTYMRAIVGTFIAFPIMFAWIGGFLTGSASPALVTVITFLVAAVVALGVGVGAARTLAGFDTTEQPLKHQLRVLRTELYAARPPETVEVATTRADFDGNLLVVDAPSNPEAWRACEDPACSQRDQWTNRPQDHHHTRP